MSNARILMTVIVATIFMAMVLPGALVRADTVDDLVEFTAGTTARADEVNGNFSAVADSVNDNDARIATLETELAELRAAQEASGGCPTPDASDEMIRIVGVCIDKHEASIWDAPVGGNQIIGAVPEDYGCRPDGQDCTEIYARSVAGVQPAANITWFQAQQALANSGKRLLTNAEWQMAVSGTPDGIPCNVDSGGPAATGSIPDCVSHRGTYDMVGNLMEFVAEWTQRATACPGWGSFSDDSMCLAGAAEDVAAPSALRRGGTWTSGAEAGPLHVSAIDANAASPNVGFRGAR